MSTYRLTHLDDATLLRDLHDLAVRDRATTAALLAHIAEVDARKLYLPAAYSSMFAYCVGELHLSEDTAYKRIRAARTARLHPRVFDEIAAGRLHLAAVVLLTPYLTTEDFDELVAAAAHRSKAEIESWLVDRFAPAAPTLKASVTGVRMPRLTAEPAQAQVDMPIPCLLDQLAPGPVDPYMPVLVDGPAPGPVNVPSPEPARFIVRVPISESTHAKLRRAQGLLVHSVPSGDLAELLDRALDALITTLEKRKAAKTDRPTASKRALASRGRTIPAAVRRAVWNRDRGRCTFTSEAGRRCESRRGLEFDHVVPFARGGEATLAGLRLRCRAHNQLEAERAFGTAFMRRKREEAGRRRRSEPVGPC